MKVLGEPGPGKGAVLFQAMTGCDCGCGLKARFEFQVAGGPTVSIDDPVMVDALIDEMREGRARLWGQSTATHYPAIDSTAADRDPVDPAHDAR